MTDKKNYTAFNERLLRTKYLLIMYMYVVNINGIYIHINDLHVCIT